MAHSQLDVDPIVNCAFIAADERSTHHRFMNAPTSFAERLDKAVRAAGMKSRTELAATLASTENPKQVAGQWVQRGALPPKYTRAFADLGLSIDYLNMGVGSLQIGRASHSVELDRQIVAAAVTLVRHVEDSVLDPIPEERRAELIAAATSEVIENWQDGLSDADLAAAGRRVIARMRSGGR